MIPIIKVTKVGKLVFIDFVTKLKNSRITVFKTYFLKEYSFFCNKQISIIPLQHKLQYKVRGIQVVALN